MANYTPQQIEEFLQEFFDVVGTRQYVGARYVPLFGRKDEESIIWDNSAPYEPLTIVLYQGNSFTSRTYVPAGVDILDTQYWANTGNYNAQVEMYRQEVLDLRDDWQDYQTDLTGQWEDYQTDLNGQWEDYKEDTDTDLATWKQETIDDFETAIGDTPIATYTNGKVYIDDFAVYCTLDQTSGEINSIAYDAANDIMYVASYISGNQCQIKKYNDWTSKQSQTIVGYDAIINITNNHCNSMTLYDNKLFCSSFGTQVITIVDCSTFTELSSFTGPLTLRAFGVSNEFSVAQPYRANELYVVMPFDETIDPAAPLDGMWLPFAISAQSSYVQDCHIQNNCYFRLCSSPNAVSRSYVEIWPFKSPASTPIVIPLNYQPFISEEYEGITAGTDKFYFSVGNTILYSEQIISDSWVVFPQISSGADDYWATLAPIQMPAYYRNSLPEKDTSSVAGFPANVHLFEVPYHFNDFAITREVEVYFACYSIEGHFAGNSTPLIYRNLPVTQYSDEWSFVGTTILGALSNGVYVLNLQVFRDNSTLSTDRPSIAVRIKSYIEITTDGTTIKTSGIAVNGLRMVIK